MGTVEWFSGNTGELQYIFTDIYNYICTFGVCDKKLPERDQIEYDDKESLLTLQRLKRPPKLESRVGSPHNPPPHNP